MKTLHRLFFVGTILIALICIATPTQTTATVLWGHPYAMQIDTTTDYGWVHMWNDASATPYVGTGTIANIGNTTGPQNTWDLLVQGMVNKKLTILWTDNGPDTNVNDASTGNIQAAVVTIFGN
ncbi:MAG: hypothetical protein KOO60_04580 [Gemmatimonadales bacterium]|nr:hypothetical protein [Gemmatimonadales bacterium]